MHEQVSVTFDKGEALCTLMQYKIELMYPFVYYFLLPNDYDVETLYWSAFPIQCFYNFFRDFDWSVGKIKLFLHFNKNLCV